MQALVSVHESELACDPSARLWAFVGYLAENSSHLPAQYSPFWLVWTYDAEVKNGGHLQYFHNRGTQNIPATLAELHRLGAPEHARLLSDCWEQAKLDPVQRVNSLHDYAEMATERSFEREDSAFYNLKPDLVDLLESSYGALLGQVVEVRA